MKPFPHRAEEVSSSSLPRYFLLLLVCSPIFLSGCRGCTWLGGSQANKKQSDEEKRKREEAKSRLNVEDLLISPSQDGQAINQFKPGHWYQAKQNAKANQGEESLDIVTELVDRRLNPIPLRGSSVFLRFNREAVLAKGQSKSSELLFYVPDLPVELDENGMPTKPAMRIQYNQRGLGTPIQTVPSAANLSKAEQYAVLIYAKDTNRHAFWSGLSCMSWPSTTLAGDEEKIAPHRTVAVKESESALSLPNNALMWSSISHLVWYDSDATLLSQAQQQAILDWIHSGGQLILSGPDALSTLTNSFLSTYMPINQIDSSELDSSVVEPFANFWHIAKLPTESKFRLPQKRAIPSLKGELTSGSRWIDGAEGIVATRQVGQGKVSVSMFPLSDDAFVGWQGFSSFVNGAILHHPPRNWVSQQELEGSFAWLPPFQGREGDPELSTRLRTLTRDGRVFLTTGIGGSKSESVSAGSDPQGRPKALPGMAIADVNPGTRGRSVGSWNDNSPVSSGAIQSLTAASGISVPKIGLIVKLLIGYLIVLVPLNWLVFRLIGRVELAWLAVPVLAMIGAAVVAKSVQLDIGFSRSETRVACLEMYEGYPRAHLTNYVSLYTSLSESYKVTYPEGNGVVLPSVSGRTSASRARQDSQYIDYHYATDEGAGIRSYPVRSNSTGMLHGEEWIELGGVVKGKLDEETKRVELENGIAFGLRDIAVVGLSTSGQWLAGWKGDLDPRSKANIVLKEGDARSRWIEQWNDQPNTQKFESILSADGSYSLVEQQGAQLSVGQMLDASLNSIEFRPGKFVVMGWYEEPVGSLTILPRASQQSHRSMFVLHLSQGKDFRLGPDLAVPPRVTDAEGGTGEATKGEATSVDNP